ncbi:MAG: hypothetical protein ACLTCI_06095 [[Clostridium] nexile]
MKKKQILINLLIIGIIILIAVVIFVKQSTKDKQHKKQEITWITEAVESVKDELEKELNSLLEKKINLI